MNWLIWSHEHKAWWKPNSCGYAKDIREAGRYCHTEAMRIVRQANHCLRDISDAQPEETMCPDYTEETHNDHPISS